MRCTKAITPPLVSFFDMLSDTLYEIDGESNPHVCWRPTFVDGTLSKMIVVVYTAGGASKLVRGDMFKYKRFEGSIKLS